MDLFLFEAMSSYGAAIEVRCGLLGPRSSLRKLLNKSNRVFKTFCIRIVEEYENRDMFLSGFSFNNEMRKER